MALIGICGPMDFQNKNIGGHTIKTKILIENLEKRYEENNVSKVDTTHWKKKPLKLLFNCIKLVSKCDNIVFLASTNGTKVFVMLFYILNFLYNKKIYFFVIGSRLNKLIEDDIFLIKPLNKLSKIYVETTSLKNKLNKLGLENVERILNFKDLDIVESTDFPDNFSEPYKLCTFSRVTEKKGVLDAINAVIAINQENDKVVYTLDIYGQVSEEFTNYFFDLIQNAPDYIQYKGVVSYGASTEIIKKYFAMLFPTKHYNEGIPGTVIDSYAAGVPVIAAEWESASEIIEHGVTGYIFEMNNYEEFKQILIKLYKNPSYIIKLKKYCTKESIKFMSSNALLSFYKDIEA